MVRRINREQIENWINRDDLRLKFVEVATSHMFDEAHILRAIHLPLGHVRAESPDALAAWAKDNLDPGQEIIVYADFRLRPEAERAAHTLDRLGFGNVCLYPEGKGDWIEAGNAIDGIFSPSTTPSSMQPVRRVA